MKLKTISLDKLRLAFKYVKFWFIMKTNPNKGEEIFQNLQEKVRLQQEKRKQLEHLRRQMEFWHAEEERCLDLSREALRRNDHQQFYKHLQTSNVAKRRCQRDFKEPLEKLINKKLF